MVTKPGHYWAERRPPCGENHNREHRYDRYYRNDHGDGPRSAATPSSFQVALSWRLEKSGRQTFSTIHHFLTKSTL
jgi:hypothetical protein